MLIMFQNTLFIQICTVDEDYDKVLLYCDVTHYNK